MIPLGASVVDVGSGAGLPGIVLAVARPDLTITLVEPLARRTAFLSEAVTALGLDAAVTVVRGRAEESSVDPLPPPMSSPPGRSRRWTGWPAGACRSPAVGGRLLALKGASASARSREHRAAVDRLGGPSPVVAHCGVGVVDPPTRSWRSSGSGTSEPTTAAVVRAEPAGAVQRSTSRGTRRG